MHCTEYCFFFHKTTKIYCFIFSLKFRVGVHALLDREKQEAEKPKEKEQEVTWYHEGPETLKIARQWILGLS